MRRKKTPRARTERQRRLISELDDGLLAVARRPGIDDDTYMELWALSFVVEELEFEILAGSTRVLPETIALHWKVHQLRARNPGLKWRDVLRGTGHEGHERNLEREHARYRHVLRHLSEKIEGLGKAESERLVNEVLSNPSLFMYLNRIHEGRYDTRE